MEMNTDTAYPAEVQADINDGFFITDPDDGFQRCRVISHSVFNYKSGLEAEGDLVDVTINVGALTLEQKEDAVRSYYGSVKNLTEDMGGSIMSANMLIAECLFEQEWQGPH